MRRVLPLAVFAVLVLIALHPLLTFGSTEDGATDEPTRITRYDAVFEVDSDSDMEVTETLQVLVPDGVERRGIFRFFDVVDPNATRARRSPDDVTVTRDGETEPFSRYDEGGGRYEVLKIGDADRVLEPGLHTYVISYTLEDVLLERDQGSRFYWNLVPGGWQQPIDAAQLTVRLPEAVEKVDCVHGTGAGTPCEVRGEGTSTVVATAEDLPPRTPVTLGTDLPATAADTASYLPWSPEWARILGGSWYYLVGVLVLVGWAVWLARRIVRRTEEEPPAFPLQYAPPPGVGPAQALYLMEESVPRRTFVAGLMLAAERRAVRLEKERKDWKVVPVSTEPELDAVTASTLVQLGVAGGHTFVAKHKDAASGEYLKSAIDHATDRAKKWAEEQGLVSQEGPGCLAAFGVVAAFVLFGLMVALALPSTAIALVPGAFAAFGLPLLAPASHTRRTPAGRELWSRLGGFKRVLATPSSQERFDFSGRRELYTAYVPWAVAFGVADEWAKKYRVETGEEPPQPHYLAGAYAGTGVGSTSRMVDDFTSTVNGAISAYSSSQSSSSGGGGGFSGGGGGGGGGGGSW